MKSNKASQKRIQKALIFSNTFARRNGKNTSQSHTATNKRLFVQIVRG